MLPDKNMSVKKCVSLSKYKAMMVISIIIEAFGYHQKMVPTRTITRSLTAPVDKRFKEYCHVWNYSSTEECIINAWKYKHWVQVKYHLTREFVQNRKAPIYGLALLKVSGREIRTK